MKWHSICTRSFLFDWRLKIFAFCFAAFFSSQFPWVRRSRYLPRGVSFSSLNKRIKRSLISFLWPLLIASDNTSYLKNLRKKKKRNFELGSSCWNINTGTEEHSMGQKGIQDYHCLFLITFPDWYKKLTTSLSSHKIRSQNKWWT